MWLLAEGSEDVIGTLPLSAPPLAQDDEIVYGPVDGVMVAYKVENVRYTAQYEYHEVTGGAQMYSCYGRTDYIVSEA